MNHTPGPWELRKRDVGYDVGGRRSVVAIVHFEHEDLRFTGNDEANTRLIASTPDLFNALDVAATVLMDIFKRESRSSFHGTRVRSDIEEAMAVVRPAMLKAKGGK